MTPSDAPDCRLASLRRRQDLAGARRDFAALEGSPRGARRAVDGVPCGALGEQEPRLRTGPSRVASGASLELVNSFTSGYCRFRSERSAEPALRVPLRVNSATPHSPRRSIARERLPTESPAAGPCHQGDSRPLAHRCRRASPPAGTRSACSEVTRWHRPFPAAPTRFRR